MRRESGRCRERRWRCRAGGRGFQQRSLLDVQFEEAGHEPKVEERRHWSVQSRIAQLADVIAQRLAAVETNEIAEFIQRAEAQHQSAAEVSRAEPRAFLASHGDRAERKHSPGRIATGCGQHGKPGRDAGKTVIVSSMRDGIQMRTRRDAGGCRIQSEHQHMNVAERIVQRLQSVEACEFANCIRCPFVALAPRCACNSGRIRRRGADALHQLPDVADGLLNSTTGDHRCRNEARTRARHREACRPPAAA